MALLALPVCAWAGDFVPPAGCEVIVTVQSRGCMLRQLMRCADNPDGHDVVQFGPDGVMESIRLDAGSLSLYSTGPDGTVLGRTEAVSDQMDMRAAAKDGHDTFSFSMVRPDGMATRHVGEIVSDGEPVVIDDVTLVPLTVERTLIDKGTAPRRQVQTLLYSPVLGVAFGATTQMTDPPGPVYDRTPVAFLFPGEAGYLSTEPAYDCQ